MLTRSFVRGLLFQKFVWIIGVNGVIFLEGAQQRARFTTARPALSTRRQPAPQSAPDMTHFLSADSSFLASPLGGGLVGMNGSVGDSNRRWSWSYLPFQIEALGVSDGQAEVNDRMPIFSAKCGDFCRCRWWSVGRERSARTLVAPAFTPRRDNTNLRSFFMQIVVFTSGVMMGCAVFMNIIWSPSTDDI